MVTRDVLTLTLSDFQNINRAHKSRNALAFIRFPILISRELKNCSEEGKTMMNYDVSKAYKYKLQVRHWMSLIKDNFIAQKTKAFVVCFFPIAHSSKNSN